jgi:hypothetical protein
LFKLSILTNLYLFFPVKGFIFNKVNFEKLGPSPLLDMEKAN